ncbi:MAG: type II toxin-antitoxin system VapC family toxin [Actinomycetales bacterium]|nr:type II toxin-antitoxin system VapC family toxin [Actinomycetales bacterium]
MNSVVVDASVALDWFLTEPGSCPAWDIIDVLDELVPVVPTIWRLEVTNVLSMQVQQRGMPIEAARTTLAEVLALPVAVIEEAAAPAIMQLSVDRRLTSYDAAYLEVAMRGGWPLATVDRQLRTAASEVGVSLA